MYLVDMIALVILLVVAPIKNGKCRVCVDFKPLNAFMKRDPYPFPLLDDIFNLVMVG